MDSFELNKIIGAILGTLLFVMGVGFVAEAIYHPIEGRGPGYELPEPEGTTTAAATNEPAPVADIGVLLASASLEDGQAGVKKCQSCHSFEKGGPNGQGPNLWDIVGRPIAGHEGFNYSDAMKEHAAEAGTWTYENLNVFLTSPKDAVPGTKMGFAGVKQDQDRADIIAFLSTLSDNPVPFPEPAPAGGGTPTEAAGAGTPVVETNANATETPTETQSESPVEGTPTGSNTPAGAEQGAGAGGNSPIVSEPPAQDNVAPAATTTTAPAAGQSSTTAPAGQSSSMMAAPAETPPATTTTTAAPPASTTTTTTAQ